MLEPLPVDGQDADDAAESFDLILAAEADGLLDLSPGARQILLDVYEKLQQRRAEAE
jgi:hypothetical protein